MFIYSESIAAFIQEITHTIQTILARKLRRKVTRDRFYDEMQHCSYPIKIVIYNNKSMLGYFSPDFYELGFHERLMHISKEQRESVIQHELAHYLLWIDHGDTIQTHGPEFRNFCKRLGWSADVYSATMHLEQNSAMLDTQESAICRKIKKLMALASSTNSHEAELAMIKAQQLLLDHNVQGMQQVSSDVERMYLKRILKQKKENAKMRAIARILETFFVSCVYNRAGEHIYLEILGSHSNVEVAEYVAGFLEVELDTLWAKAQKETRLRGQIAKNSFFLGIARGYSEKINALKRQESSNSANGKSLLVIEKKLAHAKAMAYKRLSSSRSSGRTLQAASQLGETLGKKLTINAAITTRSDKASLLLLR